MPRRQEAAQYRQSGRCPLCGRPRDIQERLSCGRCLRYARLYYQRKCEARAAEQARAVALQARMQAAGIYVAYPPRPDPAPALRQDTAPAERLLLCCGQWWTITHIPLLVPCCNRLWLQETS